MREFWMDTDILDEALKNCDLGDGYKAKVRQYPHWDMKPALTHVREVSPEYDVLVERMASLILYATSIMSKNSSAVSLFESECKAVLTRLEAFKIVGEGK